MKKFSDVRPDEVVVYYEGLFCASVCAPAELTGEQVAAQVSAVHPSATQGGWMLSEDKTFRTGEPMPAPCNKDQGRKHWLLEA